MLVVVVGCRHHPRPQRSSTVDPTSWQCRAQPLPSAGAQTSSRILYVVPQATLAAHGTRRVLQPPCSTAGRATAISVRTLWTATIGSLATAGEQQPWTVGGGACSASVVSSGDLIGEYIGGGG